MGQTDVDQVREPLLRILRTHLRLADDRPEIPMDARLEDLGLDSMGAINVLLDIEDTFDVSFPDEMLTEETFRTAASLLDAILQLTAE
jgi:acyl carrier protein